MIKTNLVRLFSGLSPITAKKEKLMIHAHTLVALVINYEKKVKKTKTRKLEKLITMCKDQC